MHRKSHPKPARRRRVSGQALTAAERMRAMRERREAAGLKPVLSWVPETAPPCSVYSSHRLLEIRSLAMHAVIVEKIERDRTLLSIPKKNLERWQARWGDSVPKWLVEWKEILRRPWTEIATFITETSENAARLRQSSPFAGVLTPVERRRIYDAFKA